MFNNEAVCLTNTHKVLIPTKCGFKVWVHADSVTGYSCDFNAYVGWEMSGTEVGLGERVLIWFSTLSFQTPAQSSSILPCQKLTSYRVTVVFLSLSMPEEVGHG